MCQRYVLPDQLAAEREFLPATAWWRFDTRFNVAAAQYVPAIRMHQAASEGVMVRWGLIPSWTEGEPAGPLRTVIHAARLGRSKGTKKAWLERQRCILPMAGFYTWHLTPEGYRQPFYVHLRDRSVFGVAGVWDRWVSEDDDVIESASMVCVPANELLSEIAGPLPGMPAILRRRDYASWLTAQPAAASAALVPYRTEWMQAHPVSPRVNSASVDDPSLIRMAG
jgi:putative SOS response-associated peptidase YedK